MSRELYVGNISEEATENDLRRLFSVAGRVTSLHLVTDPASGKFKGCAYVRMGSPEEAKDAIDSLDGALFMERLLRVNEARPQKQNATKRGRSGKAPQGNKAGRGRRP